MKPRIQTFRLLKAALIEISSIVKGIRRGQGTLMAIEVHAFSRWQVGVLCQQAQESKNQVETSNIRLLNLTRVCCLLYHTAFSSSWTIEDVF